MEFENIQVTREQGGKAVAKMEDSIGSTIARQMFSRIISDVPDIPREQAVVLVAKALSRSTLDIAFDIGLTNVLEWKPKPT